MCQRLKGLKIRRKKMERKVVTVFDISEDNLYFIMKN